MEKLKSWAKENMVVLIFVSIILIGLYLLFRRNKQLKKDKQKEMEENAKNLISGGTSNQNNQSSQVPQTETKVEAKVETKPKVDIMNNPNIPPINQELSPEAIMQNEMDVMARKVYQCRTKGMTGDCRNLELLFMSKGYRVRVSPQNCPSLPPDAYCPPLISAEKA